jgi:SAM-dependent methyltransferase
MPDEPSWEEQYKTSTALPWDIGTPAPELTGTIPGLDLPSKDVLEIGCGTGTNAIWLAQQGYIVTATELAPTALEAARKKASSAKVNINYKLSDICEELPVDKESVGFVFDRGVFHVMPVDKRSLFVDRVTQALMPGGFWLCMSGSADEVRAEGEQGPPQLSAAVIVNQVEPAFQIYRLERTTFVIPGGKKHLAWCALLRVRPR